MHLFVSGGALPAPPWPRLKRLAAGMALLLAVLTAPPLLGAYWLLIA